LRSCYESEGYKPINETPFGKYLVPDGFFAQGTFSCAPLESLNDGIFDRVEQTLIDFRRQCVVNEDVGSRGIGAKCPNGSGSQQIPIVFALEKLAQFFPAFGKLGNNYSTTL
jgi:hypothetical protein